MLKCHWWLRWGLMRTICYTCHVHIEIRIGLMFLSSEYLLSYLSTPFVPEWSLLTCLCRTHCTVEWVVAWILPVLPSACTAPGCSGGTPVEPSAVADCSPSRPLPAEQCHPEVFNLPVCLQNSVIQKFSICLSACKCPSGSTVFTPDCLLFPLLITTNELNIAEYLISWQSLT